MTRRRSAYLAHILGLGLLLAVAGCNRTDSEAVALLKKAQLSDQTVYAQGKVAVNINRPDQEVQAVAQVTRSPGNTIMTFESGPEAGAKIVREGNRFYRVDKTGTTRAGSRWGMESLPPVRVLQQRYTLTAGETESIAGYAATHVTVAPRWPHRGPTLNLWIDRNTGLVLARTREGDNGAVLFSTRWTEVKYTQPAPAPAASSTPEVAAGPSTGVASPLLPRADTGVARSPHSPHGPPPGMWPSGPHRGGAGGPGPRGGGWPGTSAPGGAGPRADTGRGGLHPRPGGPHSWGHGPRPDGGTGATRLGSAEELGKKLGYTVGVPTYLPEGFALTSAVAGPENKVGVLRYSDGVHYFAVTVMQRPADRPAPAGALGPGKATLVRWPRRTFAMAARGTLTYMVSGQLSEDTLLKVAASVP